MMKFSFCSLVVVIFVLPSIAVSSSSDLPKDLKDPVLFCEGCYGTMYELDNMMISLKNLKLDQRIQSALEKVCHTDNLRKYVFSPPKMSKVCNAMVQHFRQKLEMFLHSRYRGGRGINDPYELVKAFCIEDGTKACQSTLIPSVERKRSEAKKSQEL